MKKANCICCGKEFKPSGRLGGRLPCGCGSARCSVCQKCHDHCTCEWGLNAHIQKIAEAGQQSSQQVKIIPPLRVRIEEHLRRGDLTTKTRDLLVDALNEAETNMTLLTAWQKRASEAEAQLFQPVGDMVDRSAYAAGIEIAASVAETYSSTSTHPYDLGDCIRAKLNQMPKEKMRKNQAQLTNPSEVVGNAVDRSAMLDEAHEWLKNNCSPRRIKQYDACRLTDFAIEMLRKNGTDAERKQFLLELVTNYPDAVAEIEKMENITHAIYMLAYGVTPAVFVSHGDDGVQDRVRLIEKEEGLERMENSLRGSRLSGYGW